jgi:hypothetical protein
MILAGLGDEEKRLAKQFKLDEPWDSPHNLKLLPLMPSVYAPVGGVKAEPGHTFYQVFTGPGALYSTPGDMVNMGTVKDGTSNTLMVAEAAEAVPWTKPQDIPFDSDPKKPLPRLGGMFDGDCNACFADGVVVFIPRKAPEKVVRAMITRDGGETFQLSQLGLTGAEWGELLETGMHHLAHTALLELGPRTLADARPTLRRALSSPEAKLYAADLLSRLGVDGSETIPVLLDALKLHDGVRVGPVYPRPPSPAVALARYGPGTVPALVKALPEPGAVEALAGIGPEAKDAVPALAQLLDQDNFPGKTGALRRAWVAHALGRIGPAAQPALPSLVRMLKDGANLPDTAMHVGPAARAMGEIGPGAKEAAPVLATLLANMPNDRLFGEQRDDDVVDLAAALIRIDPENQPALGRLNDNLKPHDPPRSVRAVARAAFALARRDPKDPAPMRRLVETLPQAVGYPAVSKNLGAGDPDVPRWLDQEDKVLFSDVMVWLEGLAPQAREAITPLRGVLLHPHHLLDRRRLGSVLARIDPDACVRVWIEVLRQKHFRGKLEAVEGLAKIGPRAREAVPALREVVAGNRLDFVLTEAATRLLEQLEAKQPQVNE